MLATEAPGLSAVGVCDRVEGVQCLIAPVPVVLYYKLDLACYKCRTLDHPHAVSPSLSCRAPSFPAELSQRKALGVFTFPCHRVPTLQSFRARSSGIAAHQYNSGQEALKWPREVRESKRPLCSCSDPGYPRMHTVLGGGTWGALGGGAQRTRARSSHLLARPEATGVDAAPLQPAFPPPSPPPPPPLPSPSGRAVSTG